MLLRELKTRTCVLLVGVLLGCCALCACGNAETASSSTAADSSASSQAASESTAAESSSAAAESGSSSEAAESSSAAAATDAGKFLGKWEMYSVDDGNEEILVENADAATVNALAVTLEVKDDGTSVYHIYGTELSGTWESTGDNTVRIEFENTGDFETVPVYDVRFEGDMLVIQDGDITMKLKRV